MVPVSLDIRMLYNANNKAAPLDRRRGLVLSGCGYVAQSSVTQVPAWRTNRVF